MRGHHVRSGGTVLVTGAAGFIGSWVVEYFVTHGWRVVALVHRRPGARWMRHLASGDVVSVTSDVTHPERLRADIGGVLERTGLHLDAVVHAAGRASDVGRRSVFRKLNFEAVRYVADVALALGATRMVFLSSTDVYGLRDFRGEAEDELPLAMTVRNAYPEFKIDAERWIRETMPPDTYSVLRPAAVWGPGDTTLTPRIVAFLRWSPVIVHFGRWRGENRWPLAYVGNVAAACFLAATRSQAAGRAINVLDSERTTVDQFYRMLASSFLPGKAFRSVYLPLCCGDAVGAGVAAVSDLLNLSRPLIDPSRYAARSVSANLDFSNRRMRELFEAAGVALTTREEGLSALRASIG